MKSRLSALLGIACLLLVACGGQGDGGQGDADEPYRIGFFAPISGFAAADGQAARDAAQLAVQQANQDGGIDGRQVELVVYDDASEPDQAASLARKLVQQDQVDLVVSGSYSAQTRAAAPVIAQLGTVMIAAYAVDPEITQVGEEIWRVGELAAIQGKVGGWLVMDKLGAKRVAVLQVDNDFGAALTSSFRDYVTEHGGQIVYDSQYPLTETDYRPILSSVKQANADVVYATGYYSNAANILKQAEGLGLTAQIVGQEGYDSYKLLELAGTAANGVIFTTELNRESDQTVVKEFLTNFEEFAGHPADAVAAETYDATVLALEVLRAAESPETEDLIQALQDMQEFDFSVTNIQRFDENRNAIRPGLVQTVQDMEIQFFAEVDEPDIITSD